MGWRFLFDHQNWEHFSNIEEMKEWLKNSQIESEYGQTYSFEEFWEMPNGAWPVLLEESTFTE